MTLNSQACYDENMTEEFHEDPFQADQGNDETPEPDSSPSTQINWLETLARLGLGEVVVRIGTNLLTLVVVAIVVWLMSSFYKVPSPTETAAGKNGGPTAVPQIDISSIPQVPNKHPGVARKASIHTTIPNRPRQEVIKYTVVEGDTVIGIAAKFNLKPQTIMFGNFYTLRDDPHKLSIGEELNILPVDGTYYQWNEGDGLNKVASTFGVTPDVIVKYQPNHLDPKTIGDYALPNITPGTWIIVPGGTREFGGAIIPVGVTRKDPALARIMGPGGCGAILDGAIGIGSFIWPSQNHYISGFDYSPETNHRGIDIAGNLGEPVWAVDAGVIVYAGLNNFGYGNMVMIDHGNGWQSLYAHLDSVAVVCGQSVASGTPIGTLGNTGNSSGPHLHFELMHTLYSKVNPWDFLH